MLRGNLLILCPAAACSISCRSAILFIDLTNDLNRLVVIDSFEIQVLGENTNPSNLIRFL